MRGSQTLLVRSKQEKGFNSCASQRVCPRGCISAGCRIEICSPFPSLQSWLPPDLPAIPQGPRVLHLKPEEILHSTTPPIPLPQIVIPPSKSTIRWMSILETAWECCGGGACTHALLWGICSMIWKCIFPLVLTWVVPSDSSGTCHREPGLPSKDKMLHKRPEEGAHLCLLEGKLAVRPVLRERWLSAPGFPPGHWESPPEAGCDYHFLHKLPPHPVTTPRCHLPFSLLPVWCEEQYPGLRGLILHALTFPPRTLKLVLDRAVTLTSGKSPTHACFELSAILDMEGNCSPPPPPNSHFFSLPHPMNVFSFLF